MRSLRAAVLCSMAVSFSPALAALDELTRCEQAFSAHPDGESGQCFTRLPPADVPRAVTWLRDYVRRSPDRPRGLLYLGVLEWGGDPGAAEARVRSAAALLAAQGDVNGEIQARSFLYSASQNLALAELDVRRAERAAASPAATPLRRAQARLLEARFLWKAGRDLGDAERLLEQARAPLLRDGSQPLKVTWWLIRGNVSLQTGNLAQAQESYRELLDSGLNPGPLDTALAKYGLMQVLVEKRTERPGEGSNDEVRKLAEETLRAAAEAGEDGDGSAYRAEWILGMIAAPDEWRPHFDRCLALARGNAWGQSYCQAGRARRLAAEDPAAALELIDRSRAEVRRTGEGWARGFFAPSAVRAYWAGGEPGRAMDELTALEDLRAEQEGPSQAGLFATWSDEFYWLSGKLLDSSPGHPERVGQAFAVIERLRARTLRDAVTGSGRAQLSAEALDSRLAALGDAVEAVRRRTGDPRLSREAQAEARQDLASLARARHEIAAGEEELLEAAGRERSGRPPALADVQDALGAGEALLSFQVAPWQDWTGDFGGGSWLVVVTPGRPPRVYRLEAGGDAREKLRRGVCRLLGQITRDGDPSCGVAGGAAARQDQVLYRSLLAPAVEEMPAGVRRLVVVPDGPLYKLPFALLRPSPGEAPLGSRFQLSEVPSATLWRHWRRWRQGRPRAAAGPALALADPPLPGAGAEGALASLQELPESREEAAGVVRWLGGESWTGDEVSEHRFKQLFAARKARQESPRSGLLHFALHAVVHDREPERSALWLSPGAPQEDGLLTTGEIAGLDLAGRVVALSTCRSAAGPVLRGEGTLSIARAFLQARAQAVVGSLWPLEDRDARELFGRFDRHLGSGRSVAAALAAAQDDLRRERRPPRAWAGLVVLGDGDFVPFPGGRAPAPWTLADVRRSGWTWAAAAGGGLLLFLGGRAWRQRRQQAARSAGG